MMTFEAFLKEHNMQFGMNLTEKQKEWIEMYAKTYLQRYYGV